MIFETHVPLQKFNTFNIAISAEKYARIDSESKLKRALSLLQEEAQKPFILNGGSNILFTKNVEEPVIHLNTKGISLVWENDNEVIVEAQAGENWNDFVQYCIAQNWGGLENLSLIPGNVGTSPMQNIGAYGVEIKDCFHALKAINLESLEIEEFDKDACQFGYRESFFKQKGKNKYIIVSVSFRLYKPPHQLHTSYGAIQEVLASKNITQPTIKDISEAVIQIRQEKLPDPKVLGNAGSFFKNPFVPKTQYGDLRSKFPAMPAYDVDPQTVKIPAGWLIESAGWKGKRFGNCGVYDKQALILVNYGGATGKEICDLSEQIIEDISKKYGIHLEREVNIY